MYRRPIVVGVDASDSGRDALDWAAAEAAACRLPLCVLHAYSTMSSWAMVSEVPLPYDDASAAVAAALVEHAAARARCVASDIEVSTRLVEGTRAPAMLAQCRDAELLVIGGRALGGARGMVAGSLGARVAMHADCPVVVVHPMRPLAPGGSPARVVVGVDGTPSSGRAIEFAVRAAVQRGVDVTAVHAWSPQVVAGLSASREAQSGAEAAAWRTFQAVVAQSHLQHRKVRVDLRLVQGPAQDVLVAESAGAALVVVGSRGRGSVRAALLGSVSRAVLRRACCPVAVVRSRTS
ncbi:universal stress protein [Catenulispora rubra]|uniref:universal stress protein n=1 Tax=Catenulispora rubra TaxID=280293 RepID=UPI001892557A|nr:universal stress protein [Catenulispora rubra]